MRHPLASLPRRREPSTRQRTRGVNHARIIGAGELSPGGAGHETLRTSLPATGRLVPASSAAGTRRLDGRLPCWGRAFQGPGMPLGGEPNMAPPSALRELERDPPVPATERPGGKPKAQPGAQNAAHAGAARRPRRTPQGVLGEPDEALREANRGLPGRLGPGPRAAARHPRDPWHLAAAPRGWLRETNGAWAMRGNRQ